MIFYNYTPRPYKNALNEFDLQFKIFTLVDTTNVILYSMGKYNINSKVH